MTFRFQAIKVATDGTGDEAISTSVDVYVAQSGQTLTLPDRASVVGRSLLIKLGEAINPANEPASPKGALIQRAGADTIEGNTSYELTSDYDFVELVAGTSTWLVTKESTSRISATTKTASHTLVISDEGGLVIMDSANATVLTVPENSSVAFPVGTQIIVSRKGTGTVQVSPVNGNVTLRSVSGNTFITSQYGGATLVKIASDEWFLFGDLTSA